MNLINEFLKVSSVNACYYELHLILPQLGGN